MTLSSIAANLVCPKISNPEPGHPKICFCVMERGAVYWILNLVAYCADVVACHPKEHMEQNFKAKEDAEVHELHAADEHVVKHKRSESLKEGRDRLLQMTMLRHSAFLKTLSDMQIKTLVNKAELLDIAKGAEVLR
jgi:hypothetical protein